MLIIYRNGFIPQLAFVVVIVVNDLRLLCSLLLAAQCHTTEFHYSYWVSEFSVRPCSHNKDGVFVVYKMCQTGSGMT